MKLPGKITERITEPIQRTATLAIMALVVAVVALILAVSKGHK